MKDSNPMASMLSMLFKQEAKKVITKVDTAISNLNLEQAFQDIVQSFNSVVTEDTTEKKKDIKELICHYALLKEHTFMHNTNKNKYLLIDIINKESTDSVKFPVSAVYLDKQNKTIWCRPLIEFHEKFKLVQ